MKSIYFDNGATTKVDDSVLKAMLPFFGERFGNASSAHFVGEDARRAIEEARNSIAKLLGARHEEIIFTSSGTESNNTVLKGLFFENYPNKDHIITTKIEHDCILNSCRWLEKRGAKVTYLDVDEKGFIDLKELEKSITEKTIVVSIIHGNNEIGTIQDLKSIGEICKRKKVLFHTDACQSFTKVPINVDKAKLDFVTINAHKIHGPKGVGGLYIRKNTKFNPLLHGGGQEFGLRSATENVPGIVGFAKSTKVLGWLQLRKIKKMRDKLIENLLKIPNTKLNGASGDKRLCNNVNILFKNVEGEMLGSILNVKGISTSTGSACSAKLTEASHVLRALGMDEKDAASSLRLTLSKFNTMEEVEIVSKEIERAVNKLRKEI